MSNVLFPPIVETYTPIFIQGEDCKIPFTFSSFNSIDEIDGVDISLVNPNTNQNVLTIESKNINEYYVRIKKTDFEKTDDEYIVIIKNIFLQHISNEVSLKDILDNIVYEPNLALNQYYKAQLRFYKGEEVSEWSTATLVRNIIEPIVSIPDLTNATTYISESSGKEETGIMSLTQISGSIDFGNEEGSEFLNSYNFIILDENTEVENSGVQYTDFSSPNIFTYKIKYLLERGKDYTVYFTYTTINGYSKTLIYSIHIIRTDISFLNGTLSIEADNDNGLIHTISTIYRGGSVSRGTLRIRRSSYQSNFRIWEVLHETKVDFAKYLTSYYWDDPTAESGILYKYSIQYIDDVKGEEAPIISPNMVMLDLDDIFLLNNEVQLKIKFNPSITGLKYVVTESVTNTLGNKYPIIRRNGNNMYRQFQIGGLISFLADPEEDITAAAALPDSNKKGQITKKDSLFLSKKDAFKFALNIYENYNLENGITDLNNFIFEKLFRDKAVDFLTKNTTKLFRSNTEGNMLVQLTNISFTPNQQLGRRVYSFTATATEIDECTVDNYYKYNILTKPSDEYETRVILETVQGPNNENGYIDNTVFVSEQKVLENYTQLVLNEEKVSKRGE